MHGLLLRTFLALCLTGAVAHARPGAGECAGGEIRERGARAAGMGGAAAAVPVTGGGATRNPALLAGAACGGVLSWTPARFGMHELGTAAASWTQPFDGITAAVEVQRFGSDSYAEHRLGAGAGLRVGGMLSCGLRVSLLHIGIARYGETLLPVVDAGAGLALSEEIQVGISGMAVNMPSVADDERLPTELAAGICWRHAGMLVALDLEKETRHPLNPRIGMEITLLGVLALRCGLSHLTRQWTAGIGLTHGVFRIDYALALHSELGATHTAGIGFAP